MKNNSEKKIALIVDDSPDSLGMLNMALNNAGLTVLVALDGLQAIAITEQITPDIILLDAIMPNMDGFETCRRIKQQLNDTPIIFMTGLSDTADIVRGLEAGGVDYVTKPINPDEVIARIQVHTNNAQAASSARAALDSTGQSIIAVDPEGNPLWSTPQAQKMLNTLQPEPSQLQIVFQNAIEYWRSETTRSDIIVEGLPTTIRASIINDLNTPPHLIKLVDTDTQADTSALERALPVTRREADVLYWISRGKANSDIATILAVKPRTINKHLEQIYKKLGVDNRTAAAAMAIKALSH